MIDDRLSVLNKQDKLDYIAAHKEFFQVEPLYPLEIFEKLVEETEECLWIESSCKIAGEQLFPVRFNMSFIGNDKKLAHELERILGFFHQVESRADVQINHGLLQSFLGDNFDFNKVEAIQTGIDLRQEISDSSIKIHIKLNNYPEKLEKAIALYGYIDVPELRQMFWNHCSLIGFDFYLDGRSEIELYPKIKRGEFSHPRVQTLMRQILSSQARDYLSVCDMFGIGFSKANSDKIIYYYLGKKNDLPKYFKINNIARKVHDFYQQQPTLPGMWLALPERELQEGLIQNINLYYQRIFTKNE